MGLGGGVILKNFSNFFPSTSTKKKPAKSELLGFLSQQDSDEKNKL